MKEKMLVTSHQLLHSLLCYFDQELQYLEQQLAFIQRGNPNTHAGNDGPPPELFEKIATAFRKIANGRPAENSSMNTAQSDESTMETVSLSPTNTSESQAIGSSVGSPASKEESDVSPDKQYPPKVRTEEDKISNRVAHQEVKNSKDDDDDDLF